MDTMARKKHVNSPWPKRLKELRKKHKLSQVETAARIGIAASTLIGWENRQAIPSRLALTLLLAAFPELAKK